MIEALELLNAGKRTRMRKSKRKSGERGRMLKRIRWRKKRRCTAEAFSARKSIRPGWRKRGNQGEDLLHQHWHKGTVPLKSKLTVPRASILDPRPERCDLKDAGPHQKLLNFDTYMRKPTQTVQQCRLSILHQSQAKKFKLPHLKSQKDTGTQKYWKKIVRFGKHFSNLSNAPKKSLKSYFARIIFEKFEKCMPGA